MGLFLDELVGGFVGGSWTGLAGQAISQWNFGGIQPGGGGSHEHDGHITGAFFGGHAIRHFTGSFDGIQPGGGSHEHGQIFPGGTPSTTTKTAKTATQTETPTKNFILTFISLI